MNVAFRPRPPAPSPRPNGSSFPRCALARPALPNQRILCVSLQTAETTSPRIPLVATDSVVHPSTTRYSDSVLPTKTSGDTALATHTPERKNFLLPPNSNLCLHRVPVSSYRCSVMAFHFRHSLQNRCLSQKIDPVRPDFVTLPNTRTELPTPGSYPRPRADPVAPRCNPASGTPVLPPPASTARSVCPPQTKSPVCSCFPSRFPRRHKRLHPSASADSPLRRAPLLHTSPKRLRLPLPWIR